MKMTLGNAIAKAIRLSSLIIILIASQTGFAQIDVVYNDLVWSDEFDTPGPVNNAKWFHQTRIPAGGSWFNNEVQHYTNRLSNSFVADGNLNIVAKRENFTDQNVTKQFTSARLNSKFAFRYGRVDIRAKAPNGAGTWPALWLLGKNINEAGGYFAAQHGTTSWPACGEIDIMEHGIFPDRPINYIGSAIHTTSSSGNTVNKGGIQASNIEQNYHVYSMNWSPFQITFLLDGVAFYTYNPAIKDETTWPFDREQYLLLNIAMGGFAGAIPGSFSQTSMIIDYVRVYQNTAPDTQAPTNFTASVGNVSGRSVELKLNATDNSGVVKYAISYSGRVDTIFGTSAVEKSAVIRNLNQNTSYTFSVSAFDMAGNPAVNNPIVLNATTTQTLECDGESNEAQQGSFVDGYRYIFETLGTDVKITFELLDNRPDLVAFLWRQTPFAETPMTLVSGRTFTATITGQTPGATINYAVKFAFAGGLAVTKYISYVVGSNCVNSILKNKESSFLLYPSPAQTVVFIEGLPEQPWQYSIRDIHGKKHLDGALSGEKPAGIEVKSLKDGIYLLQLQSGNKVLHRTLVVSR